MSAYRFNHADEWVRFEGEDVHVRSLFEAEVRADEWAERIVAGGFTDPADLELCQDALAAELEIAETLRQEVTR